MARVWFFLAVLLGALGPARAAAPPAPSFDRDIAPLLARRCLECHSGAAPKADLDLSRKESALAALEPGKPEESHAWQRVRDDEMPPKRPLSASEKNLLRRWIASGAAWGEGPIDPFRFTTGARAGHDFWSLQPVRRRPPPAVRKTDWPAGLIDRFVLAALEAKGL